MLHYQILRSLFEETEKRRATGGSPREDGDGWEAGRRKIHYMLSQEETQILRSRVTKRLGGVSWIWQKVGGISVFILQLLQVPSQLNQLVWGFSCGLTRVLSLNGPSILFTPTILHLMRAVLLTLVPLAVTNYLMRAT